MTRLTTMRALRLMAVAATATVLAACGSNDPGEDDTVLEPGPAAGGSETADVELAGTTWALSQVETASGEAVAPEKDAYVTFTEDGQLEANSGCNGYGGEAVVEGDQVTLSMVVGTQIACEGATGDVDLAFGQVLRGEVTASVVDDALTLTNADGASLTFSAKSGE